MTTEIKVPVLPESVADATIAAWHKKVGEPIKRGDTLVDIETDKVVLEVVAPADGSVATILKEQGSTVTAQEIIGTFSEHDIKAEAKEQPAPESITQKIEAEPVLEDKNKVLSPAVRRSVNENNIDTSKIEGTGKDQRITMQDLSQLDNTLTNEVGARIEKRVPMSRLRAKIAERLLEAQHNAAILTTFNEVDMGPVITLRNKYKEEFQSKYGIKLGFMSFFVNAVVGALKNFPTVNASIDGLDIVYHGYYDIGIAVSTERGLVVPIVRDADTLSMADIERKIAEFGKNAVDGKLSMQDITGGTFTITNGGVFGSLMSTPIINPPQSAILGMHKIMERPVVVDKQIVIRPMMYLALSYDHRIIDGAQSVQFLVAVKEMLEDPARLLLSI